MMTEHSPAHHAHHTDPTLLGLLVCPITRGTLRYDAARQLLISDEAKLAFPIRDGIPIMLVNEAQAI
jgi:uncharacterized protein YbaR (Trm112 family)